VNGVIETATGDLLRAGFCDFVAGTGETLHADVPFPAQTRDGGFTQHHRWNGTDWILANSPAAVWPESKGIHIEEMYDTGRRLTRETWFATKTAPKVFTDKVTEITYNYTGAALTQITTKRYRVDGTVAETVTETISTETNVSSTVVRKER
jgi:hypothetical protein